MKKSDHEQVKTVFGSFPLEGSIKNCFAPYHDRRVLTIPAFIPKHVAVSAARRNLLTTVPWVPSSFCPFNCRIHSHRHAPSFGFQMKAGTFRTSKLPANTFSQVCAEKKSKVIEGKILDIGANLFHLMERNVKIP